MTHQATATREIPVAADAIWHTISRMTGMEDWYPGLIKRSEVVDRDSPQPRRHCTMQDGGQLKERVLLRDDATRTFVYAIDSHPMPAENVVGTIRIDDLGDGRSNVTWSAAMVLPEGAEGFVGQVTGMYDAGLASLERHLAA